VVSPRRLPAYRSHDFRNACASAGVRHLRTKPYTPRTNGKAERFLQTVMRECAYARAVPVVTGAGCRPAPLAAHLQRAPAAYRPRRTTTLSRLTMNNLLGNDS
jgi:transposase InsO family protein